MFFSNYVQGNDRKLTNTVSYIVSVMTMDDDDDDDDDDDNNNDDANNNNDDDDDHC